MEISKLHIDQEEFDFFTTLAPKEKIEFLHDAQSLGIDESIDKYISKIENKIAEEEGEDFQETKLNDIFQDTMHDEIFSTTHKLVITSMNNFIHLNSSSLKLIKQVVNKLVDDGHDVVIVDNSTSNVSSSAIADISHVYGCIYICLEGNLGLAEAQNIGIRAAFDLHPYSYILSFLIPLIN